MRTTLSISSSRRWRILTCRPLTGTRRRTPGVGRVIDPRTMVGTASVRLLPGGTVETENRDLCVRDVAYRVVSAQHFPDHTSIARFRKNHETALGDLFPKVLMMCAEAGLVKLGRVALDGRKIKADAALDQNRTPFDSSGEGRHLAF